MSTWVEITCEERDGLLEVLDLTPISGCTDIDGTITGSPRMETEWGDADGNPVLRDKRWQLGLNHGLWQCIHYRRKDDDA